MCTRGACDACFGPGHPQRTRSAWDAYQGAGKLRRTHGVWVACTGSEPCPCPTWRHLAQGSWH